MGITANSGPHISYGFTTTSTGGVTEYNEEAAPNLNWLGNALLDSRAPYRYYPGAPVGTKVMGLWNNEGFVNAIPSIQYSSGPQDSRPYAPGTLLSCAAGSSALTTLTLNTTVSSATGVWTSQSYPDPIHGGTQTVNYVVDYATPQLTFGSGGTVAIWNPANGIARAIAITGSSSAADDSNVTAKIAGIDLYGYPLSETITLGASSLNGVIGNKCFKGVNTITLANSSQLGSTVINIAFADKFGFPTFVGPDANAAMAVVSSLGLVVNYVAGSSIGVATGSTATVTATTSDVRGSWTSTAASLNWTGGAYLQMRSRINVTALSSITATNASQIWGVTPYTT